MYKIRSINKSIRPETVEEKKAILAEANKALRSSRKLLHLIEQSLGNATREESFSSDWTYTWRAATLTARDAIDSIEKLKLQMVGKVL